MIYTFTLNTSLDYIMGLEELKIGEINRSNNEALSVGGKGINVSRVLKGLDAESVICGFVAGNIGDLIKKGIDDLGIENKLIYVKGNSRINVKIQCQSETAINGSGCIADISTVDSLCESIKTKDDDYIVLSGSVCRGLNSDIYGYIMRKLKGRFIVDATGDLLLNSLKYKPYIIKPNNIELGEIFNCSINSYESAIYYGKKMCDMGGENVVVSIGDMGAVFVNKNEEYIVKAEKINVKNTVGAGDAMVAGFLWGSINGKGYEECLKIGSKIARNILMNGLC